MMMLMEVLSTVRSDINVMTVLLCQQFLLLVVLIIIMFQCIEVADYSFGVRVISLIFGDGCNIYS